MKKILFIILLFTISFGLTCSANLDFSLSGNGSVMSGNMRREGDNIYMHYNMNGLNSPAILNQVPAEQQQAVSNINSAEINIVFSCKDETMKINSFKIKDTSGYTLDSNLNTGWMPMNKAEDVQKLRELCGKL